jgi:predicted TIM-barrel fold metal-dependent hydrolase
MSRPEDADNLLLIDYQPRARLVTKETLINTPRFPVVDAHNHLGGAFGGGWDQRPVAELIDVLDEAGVVVFVDLDGGWGEVFLHRHLDKFKAAAPERFVHFGGVDWSQWAQKGRQFGGWAAAQIRQQAERGAQGIKVWKNLGLQVTDHEGYLVPVDDRRLDPIWAVAGELGLPVLIHIADPIAFFDPVDRFNERWEELHHHPDWQFPFPPYPAFESIVTGMANVVLAHPDTTFIGAHVGCYAENLAWVASLLDQAPNFYVDIGARLAELGRQPYSARRFLIDYSDRILFGTDLTADPEMYRLHYRFLETDDEYFSYSPEPVPPQGRWNIYGVYLPDNVLEKIYHSNAQRVLGIGMES